MKDETPRQALNFFAQADAFAAFMNTIAYAHTEMRAAYTFGGVTLEIDGGHFWFTSCAKAMEYAESMGLKELKMYPTLDVYRGTDDNLDAARWV